MNNWIDTQQSALEQDFLAWQTVLALDDGDRHENQDNLLLITPDEINLLQDGQAQTQQHPDWSKGRIRIAVLDGMGGQEGGQEISQRTAEALAAI